MKLNNLFVILILSLGIIKHANSETYKYSASNIQTLPPISQSNYIADNMRSFFWYDRLTLVSPNGWRSFYVDNLSYAGDLISGKLYDVIPGGDIAGNNAILTHYLFVGAYKNALNLYSCIETNPYYFQHRGQLVDKNYIYRGVRVRGGVIVALDTYGNVNLRYEPIDKPNSDDYWFNSIYRFDDHQEYKGGDIVSITNYLKAIVAVARINKMITIEIDSEYDVFGGNHKFLNTISLDGEVMQMEIFREALYVLMKNGKLSIFDISTHTPVFQKTIQVSQTSANCMKVNFFQWGRYLQIGAGKNYLLYSLNNSIFEPEKIYFETDNLRESQIASIACDGNSVYLLDALEVTAFYLNRETLPGLISDNINISVRAGESITKQINISGGIQPYSLSISRHPSKGKANINNFSAIFSSGINDSGTDSFKVLIQDSAHQKKEINVNINIIPCPKPESNFTFVPVSGYAPLEINFNDISKPGVEQSISNRLWDFDDNHELENQVKPSHTFITPGKYDVSLKVKNSCGNEAVKTMTIEVFKFCSEPTADFIYTPQHGHPPLDVRFIDQSTPGSSETIIERIWDFGDGEPSYEKDPGHTYLRGGTFEVKLMIKNSCGNIKEITKFITITKFQGSLQLLLPETAIENINSTSITGKLLIPSAHEIDTVINLSANTTDLKFPQTTTIPASLTEVSFTLQTIDNEKWGSQKVCLTASALGYSSAKSEIIIIDNDMPTQSPETIYAFSDGNHRIKLLWPLQSMSELDPLSFEIYRSDSENGFYYQVNRFPIVKTQVFENKPVYEFIDTDLQYQTTYWYKIKTIRSNYFESDFSLPVSIVPEPHPNTGDFRLEILDPVQYVGPNQNAIFNISIMSEDYFDEIVNLSATCNRLNPQYLTFSRQSIPPETSTQLIVSLPFNIDSGEYTIQVAGISTCCSHLSTITLKVVVPGTGESAIAVNASPATVGLNDTLFLKGNIIPYIPSDTPYFIHIKPPESNHWNKYPGILQTNSLFTFNKYQPDQQGEYLIKASWDGNDYYRGSESNETVLIVGKGKSQLLCSMRNEDISPGSLFYLTVELYPQLSGQPITIQVIKPDESTETAGFQLTNEDGMVSLTYLLNEQTGIWKFTAYWPGNETYVGTQSHPFVIYPGIETGQAIIVAGGGMTDHLWEFSEFFTKEFYLFLKKKRFSHDQIMYFSDNSNDYDDNGDGIYEIFVDNHEPLANDVLTYIAGLTSSEVSEKKPLILYMHAHGSEDKFLVNTYSDFSATQLDDALDDLQEDTNCTVALILDACKSGAFIEKLTPDSNQKRILISSAENTVARNIVDSDHEYWSFSNFLMDALSIKSDLESGFLLAAHKMSGRHEFNTQTPVIIKSDDTVFDSPFYIGGLSVTEAAFPPEILSTTPNQVITQGRFNLFAHVYSLENIQSVKASIMPPFLTEQIHKYRPDVPIQNIESISLYDMDHDNSYEGEYNFVYQGTYSITFFARDVDNNVDQKTILLTLENGQPYSYLNDAIAIIKVLAGMSVQNNTILHYFGCKFDLRDAIYWMGEVSMYVESLYDNN